MKNYSSCDKNRWVAAQKWELEYWSNHNSDGDDWNYWWKEKFNNYSFLNTEYASLLEVGCGPFARNTQIIKSIYPDIKKISLSDPLLVDYINSNKEVGIFAKNNNCKIYPFPLEELDTDELYDIVVCINVFDHVYDVNTCFDIIYKALNKNGILILGQDLTNEEDFKLCPETITDVGHPIKLSDDYLSNYLSLYNNIYYKMLPRNEGRNPAAHYGTLLFAGSKK